MASVGEKIKKRRIELGLSLRELAKRMGYANQSTVSRIERGIIDIPQSKVVKFAEVLNTTIAYLMDWEDEQAKPHKTTHSEDDPTMGDVIKQLRMDRHLSIVELSEEIGIPVEDIREYEEGTKQLHASEINKISEFYNIEAAVLIDMLLSSSGKGVTWEQHKLHIDHMIRWNEEFGYEVFTDEERDQLANYARFLLSQRKK